MAKIVLSLGLMSQVHRKAKGEILWEGAEEILWQQALSPDFAASQPRGGGLAPL